MRKTEEYEKQAARCLRLARVVSDAESKAALIEMVRAWQKLANRVRARSEEEKV